MFGKRSILEVETRKQMIRSYLRISSGGVTGSAFLLKMLSLTVVRTTLSIREIVECY